MRLFTTPKITLADPERLHRLQSKLEALMSETRVLRQRLELLIGAHELAVKALRTARRRHRPEDLRRAHRLF